MQSCCRTAVVLLAVWLVAVGGWWAVAADRPSQKGPELPPVPGFGEQEGEQETVPGFGKVVTLEDLYEQNIIDYVDKTMLGRYDTNKNRQIDAEEFGRIPWRDSPKQDDKDGDGCLTREELAGRAVRRWGSGKKPPAKDTIVPGFGEKYHQTPSRSSTRLEDLYEPKVLDYVDHRILRYYDKNRNKILEPPEVAKVKWADDWKQDDTNGDGHMTRAELAARMARRWKWGKKGARSSSTAKKKATVHKRSPWDKEDDRKSYRFRTATERLPEGLPDWFAEKDADGDGQVSMAEFSSNWSDSTVEQFRGHDRNGDGLITAKEALAAESK